MFDFVRGQTKSHLWDGMGLVVLIFPFQQPHTAHKVMTSQQMRLCSQTFLRRTSMHHDHTFLFSEDHQNRILSRNAHTPDKSTLDSSTAKTTTSHLDTTLASGFSEKSGPNKWKAAERRLRSLIQRSGWYECNYYIRWRSSQWATWKRIKSLDTFCWKNVRAIKGYAADSDEQLILICYPYTFYTNL